MCFNMKHSHIESSVFFNHIDVHIQLLDYYYCFTTMYIIICQKRMNFNIEFNYSYY